MDSFRLCLALGPLAMYLLVLAAINLSRRPFLVTGARDLVALGVGVSGLVLIGPIELVLPEDAATAYRGYVWLLLLAMYALCLTLAALVARPRLTIYNFSAEELRALVADALDALDPDARWAGNSLVLPRLRVELHLEQSPALRNVSLVASGDLQSYAGWRRLEQMLAGRLKSAEAPPNLCGLALALVGLAMTAVMGWELVSNPQAITQGFRDMLRL